MISFNKNTRLIQETPYNLPYHLKKTANLRLQGKIRALIMVMPEKFNAEVKFTKRRIWFSGNNKKFMQVVVGKNKLFIKIKTENKWRELNYPAFEDFRRIYFYLKLCFIRSINGFQTEPLFLTLLSLFLAAVSVK
ncbi:MAG: hypothetical protein ABIE43_01645 [Patescibacteria group bacterium]